MDDGLKQAGGAHRIEISGGAVLASVTIQRSSRRRRDGSGCDISITGGVVRRGYLGAGVGSS